MATEEHNLFSIDNINVTVNSLQKLKLIFGDEDVRYLDNPISISNKKLLTFEDPLIKETPNFNGVLKDEQRVMLYEMEQMMKYSAIAVDPRSFIPEPITLKNIEGPALINNENITCICGKMSFGKTILTLAWICKRVYEANINKPNPYLKQQYHSELIYNEKKEILNNIEPSDVIIIQHFDPVFESSVVLLASSMISQWEDNIKHFAPTLNYYILKDKSSLNKFAVEYNNGKAESYDIILVKIGNSAFNVEAPEPILSSLASILDGRVPRELIVDDYDTVELKTTPLWGYGHLWLISSEIKEKVVRYTHINHEDPTKLLMSIPMRILSQNTARLNLFNAEFDSNHLSSDFNLTKINFDHVVINGNSKNAIKMINLLNNKHEFQEMLHADAFTTAADYFGGIASNITELLKLVLGNKYHKMKFNSDLLIRAKNDLLLCDDKVANDGKYWKYLHSSELNQAFSSAEITEAIIKLQEMVDHYLKTISVFCESLRSDDGDCSCCSLSCTGKDVYVLAKCCPIMLCKECIFTNGKLITSCIMCANPISSRNIIFCPASNNITQMLDHDISTLINKEEPPVLDVLNEKEKFIIQLVTNVDQSFISKTRIENFNDYGLLSQTYDIELPDNIIKKIIIFTSHAETGVNLHTSFGKYQIQSQILHGSVDERANIFNIFENSDENNILIINNIEDCAGRNLQFATHAIIYNATNDHSIRQFIGRAHRIGRKYNLSVTYLTYQDEECNMITTV